MDNQTNHSATSFLTFLFSLLPGAGHMYLGLMRRGIEIMFAFFGSIFIVASTFKLPEIGVPLSIVIFFYGIFDAMHLKKAITRGDDVPDENFIKISNHTLNGYHIGIGIMVIGLLFLLERMRTVAYFLNIPSHIYSSLESSVAPLIIIGIGLYLLLKSRKIDKKTASEE